MVVRGGGHEGRFTMGFGGFMCVSVLEGDVGWNATVFTGCRR